MNKDEFVAALRECVRRPAIEGTLRNVTNPPGRYVPDSARQRADWWAKLSEEDRAHLSSVVIEAVDQALFGFLAVLDGERIIEPSESRGILELTYHKAGETLHLNSAEDGDLLHDIYNAQEH